MKQEQEALIRNTHRIENELLGIITMMAEMKNIQ